MYKKNISVLLLINSDHDTKSELKSIIQTLKSDDKALYFQCHCITPQNQEKIIDQLKGLKREIKTKKQFGMAINPLTKLVDNGQKLIIIYDSNNIQNIQIEEILRKICF